MEPDDIIAAVRNDEVRAALTDANQKLADFLKEETDKLLDSVLYTTSMKMKNGFHMSTSDPSSSGAVFPPGGSLVAYPYIRMKGRQ